MGTQPKIHVRMTAVLLTAMLVAAFVVFSTPPPASAAEQTYSGMTLKQVQAQILKETNAYRKSQKLPPLKANSSMNTVAVNWSNAQAKAKKMSHNPNYAKQIPKGWHAAGENVAYGYAPTAVTKGWWNSPGHKANMLSKNFTHIGIGVAKDSKGLPYYTQVFGGYKKDPAGTTAAASVVKKYVTKAALNLRKAPSTSAAKIITIPKGANVGVAKGKSGKWVKVTYKSKTGWVHGDYLK